MRQQGRGDLVLCPEQALGGGPVGRCGDRLLEPLADRRQCCDQFGAARNQCGDALDAVAVVLQPRRDAVDHVLLLGCELQPRLLQELAQCRGGLADPIGLGALIGDEIAGREPQLVHAPVDLLGQVADALQPLKFGEGRIDVPDGEDAGHAGRGDDGQQQQKAAKGQLTDRERERSYPSDDGIKGHGFRDRLRVAAFIRWNRPAREPAEGGDGDKPIAPPLAGTPWRPGWLIARSAINPP